MKAGMQRIEFSDTASRLRRNVMATATLIAAIVVFDIKVGKAAAQGMELDGLTTNVVLCILAAVMAYHVVAFIIRAYEEYLFWDLTFSNAVKSTWSDVDKVVDVAFYLRELTDTVAKVSPDGMTGSEGKLSLSDGDIRKLKEAGDALSTYAKRYKNFPTIMRWRFWLWDIGIACLAALAALGLLVWSVAA